MVIACIVGLLPGTIACACQEQVAEPTKQGRAFEELPWQIRLGLRSASLTERIPVIDQVVLVPDLATWLDEIERWSLRGRWPVLLEDDRYTRLFVRSFKPGRIIRRAAVRGKDLPGDADVLEARAGEIARSAWSVQTEGNVPESLSEIYEGLGWVPPGIVATSFEDPAWPAALALAIGRGQFLEGLEDDYGSANKSLGPAGVARLESAIQRMFEETGLSWEVLGDDLDAFTLCMELPIRVELPLPESMRVNVRNRPGQRPDAPLSLTDYVCRNVDGSRFAICGWIWGSHERSIYMAMCSLFIERDSVMLVNSYESKGNWKAFDIIDAGGVLQEAGYEVQGVNGGENATLGAWQRLVMDGIGSDVLVFNSSGPANSMNLGRSTVGKTKDIPALSHPLALHMIHSFSLRYPEDRKTIGGRWLDRGVYAYVGSCEEPYLHAFMSPDALVERIVNFVPFLVASRMDNGEMGKPWRVVTIGDPLMLIEPPPKRKLNRVRQVLPVADGDVDLRMALASSLRGIDGPVDPAVFRDLYLLSHDELARKLWERELQDAPEAGQAEAILPLLFSQGDASGYLEAYRLAGEPDGEAREMLWTLHLPRLQRLRSMQDLALFQRSLRPGLAAEDLTELLPLIERMQGKDQRREAIARAIERAEGESDRDRLRALLSKE